MTTPQSSSNTFVVLLGPSGVGKTTLIRGLLELSDEFEYVKPFMTRPLRAGERDKISVSVSEFERMERDGDFLVVNEHYGFKYGTPRAAILDILASSRTPILDYQLSTIENLYDPSYRLLNIYVQPESIEDWEDRLRKSEQFDERRLELGRVELLKILNKREIKHIDEIIVNKTNNSGAVVKHLYDIIFANNYSAG